ncbi:MAG: O-antigen ligase family protein [Acidobacteriota bacterium]
MSNEPGYKYHLANTGKSWPGLLENPGCLVAPLIIASVISSIVSVAASGIFMGLGIVAWISDCVLNRKFILSSPPFKRWLLLFLLLTVVSALFSKEPLQDIWHLKICIKFIIPFLLLTYITRPQVKTALFWIFGISGISMVWGFLQFLLSDGVNLLDRIDGFMSHWMTYSGQLMMVSIACTAYGIYFLKSRKGVRKLESLPWFLFSSLMAGILVLTYTRSAWGGMLGGLAVLTALNLRSRWVLALSAAVIFIFVMMPAPVHERISSGFDPRDTTTRGRLDIWRSGISVALENPVIGVGFSSVAGESLKYRRERDLPEWAYQHSHNNVIQVAATSGIPAVMVWIAMWLKILQDFFRIRLQGREDEFSAVQASAGISILIAFHLMGLMEFNFGDSEVLTLLLFFISVPYVLSGSFLPQQSSGSGNMQ